jgi:hypothetical protein
MQLQIGSLAFNNKVKRYSTMKLIRYTSLIALIITIFIITPCFAKDKEEGEGGDNNRRGGGDNRRVENPNRGSNQGSESIRGNEGENNDDNRHFGNDNENDNRGFEHNGNDDFNPEYRYQYHGQYHNFNDYDHDRRYFYNGEYYNFDDYYNFYLNEEDSFTYEGTYDKYPNVFIFTDKYGNEFDLYIKPVMLLSKWFTGYPMQPGETYLMLIRPYRYYAPLTDISGGLSFSFGWGNLALQNNRYYDLFNSPELINYDGQLYISR